MSLDKIIFTLDSETRIEFLLQDPYDIINCCDWAQIVVQNTNQSYVLSSDVVRHNIHIFNYQLNKALHNELPLHPSLRQHDIGYLYNQELQEKSGLTYKKWQGRDHWVGHDYILWESLLTAWIYNDEQGGILFEITPVWSDNCTLVEYNDYDEWIQSYSPCLIKKIPKKIASEWLEQTNRILKDIASHVEKEKEQYKDE